MPITLKLGELVNTKPKLEKLIKCRFSFTTNYRLARRLKVINSELVTYDESRTKLVTELGTPLNDKSGRVQLMQVSEDQLKKAKEEVALKKSDASRAKTLYETSSGSNEEKADLKKAMETLDTAAQEAEDALPILEKHMKAWPLYVAANNELLNVDVTLDIDPIRISELQPPANDLCDKCGQSSTNEALSVEDIMILFPLLVDDAS
jgi:hypothetical protein